MPFIDASDGTRLYYAQLGTGAPLLLVHRRYFGSAIWEYQIPALTTNGVRSVVYDQRGCGRSDHPGAGYDFDTLADGLATIINALDVNELARLIVHGSADPFCPLEVSSIRTHRAVAGSRLKVYEGASHRLSYTFRDGLNADLISFVGAGSTVAGRT
jgi:pimeloyl-ACP methyl ester carboxylesterase